MDSTSTRSKIEELIEGVAADLGFMIYESAVLVKGANSRVTVSIDHLKGITHNDCEAFSRELIRRLDEAAILPNYSLEVSSPGLTRKLRTPVEFARFAGSKAKVIYEREGQRTFCKGVLEGMEDNTAVMRDEGGEVRIPLDSVVSAHLEF